MEDRAYQARAIANLRTSYARGKRKILLVSPTGSGKTYMGGLVAAAHLQKGESHRVNWFAPRRELLKQAAKTFQGLGVEVGIDGLGARARVQCISVQAAVARGEIPECTLGFLDEAHHYVGADDWSRIGPALGDALVVGATATPERGDGVGLGAFFDDMILVAQISELTRAGHLVPLVIKRPGRMLAANRIAQSCVVAYQKFTPGGHAILFGASIAQLEDHVREFLDAGISCELVTGKTPKIDRDAMIERFRSGETMVLASMGVLTEGFDATIADVCIVARGCGSQGLWIQMCGRVLRPHPGKLFATLLDLRGISHDPALGDPTADRIFSLDGVGISLNGSVRAEHRFCPCGELLDDVDPGDPCPSCGLVKIVPRCEITGEEITEWKATIRKDDGAMRLFRLTKWMRDLEMRQKKVRSAFHKFRAVYGEPPSPEMIEQAVEILNQEKRGAA